MNLREAFAPEGIVAVVGAGGKKSTLYALAAECQRAVVTTTVRIPPFEGHVDRLEITDDPVAVLEANDEWPLGLVPGRDGDRKRYLGYETDTVDAMVEATDAPLLTKADGARTRWLKAPKEDEPQIPDAASVVVPVASVKSVGEPLAEEHVHRPERVADLTGREPGEEIQPEDVVTVLTHENGGLKDVPEDARVVALLNMVDDEPLEATAREITDEVLAHPRIDRVVLGRMDLRKVVDVVA
ncbi:putative selenium-dependent hydroxylase accessory protein YqeC [Natronomonas halophila]|uniref:selenium cofactor biosynthesis protein YqeC n=1 Tax=Natronomonas halophila TaxID=2747817 RepID=UPI0015B69BE2|nr:selenium cofactor biosynthesis protein YqeC [Natronomonas halophila]QLD87176.1 putative selenium-dependent hydroxylase accessory protein YqeC [Natronomonas halophila]